MANDIGAGAGGAIGLREVLQQQFAQVVARQQAQAEQQRIKIAQQTADDNTAYRNEALKSQQEDRAARQLAQTQLGAERFASTTPMGSQLGPDALSRLAAGGMSGPEFVQHKDATIGSTNLSGVANNNDAGPGIGAAPRITRIARTQNPGQAASDTFLGTSGQKAVEQARQDKEAAAVQARQDRIDAAAQGKTDKEDLLRTAASLRPAPQAPLVMVQTVDEQGNPVSRFVKKEEGGSYVKPANATTATRVSSAETVNKVGNDLISKLSDPRFAATVGPAMGRASSLQDFIGNPPPEFSELAGEIESYALANMGVHGMRSAQGAEAIKKMMDGRHTPESLIGTIKGLNNFSTSFVEGNKPKAGGGHAAAPAAGGTAPRVVKYDMNGNPIKD